jgi:hypothetical protein
MMVYAQPTAVEVRKELRRALRQARYAADIPRGHGSTMPQDAAVSETTRKALFPYGKDHVI